MLRFSREISTDILIDFDCGIQKMDEFIHGSLDTFLKNDPRYNFYVAVEDGLGVVGIFVTSAGIWEIVLLSMSPMTSRCASNHLAAGNVITLSSNVLARWK